MRSSLRSALVVIGGALVAHTYTLEGWMEVAAKLMRVRLYSVSKVSLGGRLVG
jgi:hypothetical protein